jgi:hypothetical protein
MIIKNTSPGIRGINIVGEDDMVALMINPGETTADVILADPKCPVFLGMVASRELEVQEAPAPAAAPAPAPVAPAAEPAASEPAPKADDSKKKG